MVAYSLIVRELCFIFLFIGVLLKNAGKSLSILHRDSATFLELEKLMHDKDKDLLKEDDTGSFEAMELRLKTPRNVICKHALLLWLVLV